MPSINLLFSRMEEISTLCCTYIIMCAKPPSAECVCVCITTLCENNYICK